MTRGFPIRMQPGSSATNYGSNVALHQLRPGSNAFNLRLAQMAGQGKSPAPFMGANMMGINALLGRTSVGHGIPKGPINILPSGTINYSQPSVMPNPYIPAGVLGGTAAMAYGASELANTGKPTPMQEHTEMLMADPYAVQLDGRTTMQHYIEKYGFSALPESLRFGG